MIYVKAMDDLQNLVPDNKILPEIVACKHEQLRSILERIKGRRGKNVS